jgi:hypothetical protein
VVARIGDRFRQSVRSFADANKISMVGFRKGDRKFEKMKPYLARQARTGRSGVAAIGWAQEFQWVASCTIAEGPPRWRAALRLEPGRAAGHLNAGIGTCVRLVPGQPAGGN